MSSDEQTEAGPCLPGTLPGTNASLNLSGPGLCNSSVTLTAPVSFTWQDLSVLAVSCIVIAVIVVSERRCAHCTHI